MRSWDTEINGVPCHASLMPAWVHGALYTLELRADGSKALPMVRHINRAGWLRRLIWRLSGAGNGDKLAWYEREVEAAMWSMALQINAGRRMGKALDALADRAGGTA